MAESRAGRLAYSYSSDREPARAGARERAEARYEAIFNAIRDAALIVDGARHIESLNLAAEKMFGYRTGELIGQPLARLFPSSLDAGPHACRLPAPCDCALPAEGERRIAASRRDGTSFPTELRLVALPPGDERRALAIVHDLSRESDLRAAKEAAEAANLSKSSFLANMSHELRTPLNAIIGFAEILIAELHGPLGSPRYGEYARDIRDSGDHLLQLINHILDLSRIEVGRYELRRELILAGELIKGAIRFVALNAQQAGIELVCEIEADLAPAWLDRRAVRQVLLNLLANAIKFTRQGGTVKIAARCEAERLVVAVSDNGIGIPANDLARLARPFEQVANPLTRDHEGSGLGLAISKALVEAHGGRLSIESAFGVGTTVTIALPLAAEAEAPAHAVTS